MEIKDNRESIKIKLEDIVVTAMLTVYGDWNSELKDNEMSTSPDVKQIVILTDNLFVKYYKNGTNYIFKGYIKS